MSIRAEKHFNCPTCTCTTPFPTEGKNWKPEEKLVCMAMDSVRLCFGIPTRNFEPDQIRHFINKMALKIEGLSDELEP